MSKLGKHLLQHCNVHRYNGWLCIDEYHLREAAWNAGVHYSQAEYYAVHKLQLIVV